MAFNFIESRLNKTLKKVKAKGTLNEENIKTFLGEIRLTLLESDVNLKVVNQFISDVEKKALGQIVDSDRTASQELLKIINEELIKLLGGKVKEWEPSSKSVVMMVGLQGSGKTTSTVKLANFLSKKKSLYKKPLLVGLDVYRPAAIDQLEKLSKIAMMDFFSIRDTKNVEKITKEALKFAEKNDNDLIIFDTAGRLQTDDELMNELVSVKKIIKPSEIIFVSDAMAGQEILNVVSTFDEKLSLTSAIITKLDSNAKGGTALSLSTLIGLRIMFIGTGEKISNFEVFHPDRQASRLLGLGDIETLIEQANEVSDENQQEKMYRKIMSGKYDLDDLLNSMKQVAKMGNLGSLSKMLPGANLNEGQIESAETKMKYFEVLINSMTLKERRNPKILKHPKRKNRVLNGSGRTVQEFNDLLRQFEKSQKQMKEMAKYIKMGKMPNMGGNFNAFG